MEATKDELPHCTRRVLILKFSSIGDIFQALAAAHVIHASWDRANNPVILDWAIRGDLAPLLEELQTSDLIRTIFAHSRRSGLFDLVELGFHLTRLGYTHVYDAHGSLRSRLLCAIFRLSPFWTRKSGPKILRRPKHRIRRFLALQLGIQRIAGHFLFSFPFNAQESYTRPLRRWGIDVPIIQSAWHSPKLNPGRSQDKMKAKTGIIVPGSAWHMKNWSVSQWRELLELIARSSLGIENWGILGGQSDEICDAIESALSPKDRETLHLENWKGTLSLRESMQKIGNASLVVGVDTGWIHWANHLGLRTVAIQGPSAFGGIFGARSINSMAPARLSCQPCSKDGSGRCRNAVKQKCLRDVSPQQVFADIQIALSRA